MDNKTILVAMEGFGIAAFLFLAAVIPRLRSYKFRVTRYSFFSSDPPPKMSYSARTFVVLGCFMTAGTLFAIFGHDHVFGEWVQLLMLAFGVLMMLVIIISIGFDAISGDNPKTLKIPKNNDEDLV